MARAIGYGLLLVSCLAWALLVLLPFAPVATEHKLAWGAGLYIFGQMTWLLCLPLLGRELLDRWRRVRVQIKTWLGKNPPK